MPLLTILTFTHILELNRKKGQRRFGKLVYYQSRDTPIRQAYHNMPVCPSRECKRTRENRKIFGNNESQP
jgi:hypothetical protein